MARKSVLTKEQIIECAFDLCVKEGIPNSTIRNIASQLNTSTHLFIPNIPIAR